MKKPKLTKHEEQEHKRGMAIAAGLVEYGLVKEQPVSVVIGYLIHIITLLTSERLADNIEGEDRIAYLYETGKAKPLNNIT